jgi:hypothetical protein
MGRSFFLCCILSAEKCPTIAQFPRKETAYCVFYEDHIYTSMPMLDNVDYMELSKALMCLRNASASPAVLTIREHEWYSMFSRHLQTRYSKTE